MADVSGTSAVSEMPDILNQRVASLVRGLTHVAELSMVLAESAKRIKELSRASAMAKTELELLVTQAESLVDLLGKALSDEGAGGDGEDSFEELDAQKLYLVIKKVAGPAATLKDDLTKAAEQLSRIAGSARVSEQQLVAFDPDLAGQVKKVADHWRSKLDDVGRTARRGEVAQAWAAIGDDVVPATQRVLAQYVDLLGGISIRERGVSMTGQRIDDLCDISYALASGELSKSLSSGGRYSLMIPAREAALRFVDLPVLTLGVGQWSLWGLPLVAHEFGRLAAGEQIAAWIRAHAASARGDRALFGAVGLETLAADVIATWALGPAYVAALLYLELDPRGKPIGRGRLTDADRACIARCALVDQPRGSLLGYDFPAKVVDPLFARWRAAEKQARAPKIDESRSSRLAEIAAGLPVEIGLDSPFSLGDWGKAIDLALLSDVEAAKEFVKSPEVGLRHVLNAAWWARLGLGRDVVATEEWAGELANLRMRMSTGKPPRAGSVSKPSMGSVAKGSSGG
ncbi:hypothetical protein [Geodermatophilus sp. URMC 64]